MNPVAPAQGGPCCWSNPHGTPPEGGIHREGAPANQMDPKPPPKSWLRREWRWVAGLALSVLCLYLAGRKVSWVAIREALAAAKWPWVVLAAAIIVLTLSLKAVRWRDLFLPQKVPLRRVWSVYMTGQMLNAVFPARAGDIGRIYLIGEEGDVSRAAALSTVVVEKVLDLVMLTLAYLMVAWWLALTPTGIPEWLRAAGTVLIPLTILALAAVLLLSRFGQPLWQSMRRALHPLPRRWQAVADAAAARAIPALSTFYQGRATVQIWIWTLGAWVLMALTNVLLFHAFDMALSPFVGLFLLVVLMSGVAIPPLPGNVGILVYLCVLALSLFGVQRETALVYGVTLQIVSYAPPIVFGAACTLLQSRSASRAFPTSN